MKKKISFPFDPKTEIITIDGVGYHRSFFTRMAEAKAGTIAFLVFKPDADKVGVRLVDVGRLDSIMAMLAEDIQKLRDNLSQI